MSVHVYDSLEALAEPMQAGALAIGNFDGVHRGHQQLIATARELAADSAAPVVVLTFEPHPLTVLRPDHAPARLSTIGQKCRWLGACGAEAVVLARSTPALFGMEAEDFIDQVIRAKFHPRHIVEGPMFRFGRGRRGTPELLQARAASFGGEVHILEPVSVHVGDGGGGRERLVVSSSIIRDLLSCGQVEKAAICLGRPHTIRGTIVSGQRRGRSIGFPTANFQVEDQLVPAEGVYAGRVEVAGEVHDSAVSIGKTPTFDGETLQVEAHLLDFNDDLYGKELALAFHTLIRGQRKFRGADDLVAQLHRDVEAVREYDFDRTNQS